MAPTNPTHLSFITFHVPRGVLSCCMVHVSELFLHVAFLNQHNLAPLVSSIKILPSSLCINLPLPHSFEAVNPMATKESQQLEPWHNLNGKVVMVTGASSGIGREFCIDLAGSIGWSLYAMKLIGWWLRRVPEPYVQWLWNLMFVPMALPSTTPCRRAGTHLAALMHW